MLKEADYKDSSGRMFRVLVEEGEEDLSQGIIVGPPFLTELQLPRNLEVRLHNELFVRGLFTMRDVLRKGNEVDAALRSALRLDVQTIIGVYRE